MQVLEEINAVYTNKIKSVDDLVQLLEQIRENKKVIMCHGVFDIVHPGHIRHLLYAKSKGDILVVSITPDRYISKGEVRPHVPERLRVSNLAAFEFVDYAIIDTNPEPYESIKKIKPDYFAKGYEYFSAEANPKTHLEKTIVESYGGEMIFTPGDIVYSSSKFIEASPPKITDEKLISLMEVEGITFREIRECICNLHKQTVHIVGDTILDSYTHCSMIGGMTKTPTMSVRFEKKTQYIGGAAIVAKHLRAAGASVVFSTVLGDDATGKFILEDLEKAGVDVLPFIDPLRPTTEKNAIVVGNYRLLKIDSVDNRPVSDKILNGLTKQISSVNTDIVLFSDFRHGIFNSKTLPTLVSAIPKRAFKVADSQVASRWGNILDFQGFDLITPNEREARFSLGDQDSVVRHLGAALYDKSKVKTLFLKLGEKGLIVFHSSTENRTDSFFIDSLSDTAIDPVGAGDALLAYAALSLSFSKNEVIAAIVGSLAAALECEFDGNTTISPKKLLKRLDFLEKRIKFEC